MAGVDNDYGGYDYQFVDAVPDDLICKICHCPSRDPYLTICCGQTFCKSCLDKVDNMGARGRISKACPFCRSKSFKHFKNKQADRNIKGLRVTCINKECPWKGELKDLNNHTEQCPFEVIVCPNNCGKRIQRSNMLRHESNCIRRKYHCGYCNLAGQFMFITTEHVVECPMYPLPCPNKCTPDRLFHRKDLKDHYNKCPLALVNCRYHDVGCTVMIARKDQENHCTKYMQFHLTLSEEARKRQHSKFTELAKKIDQLQGDNELLSDQILQTQCQRNLEVNRIQEQHDAEITNHRAKIYKNTATIQDLQKKLDQLKDKYKARKRRCNQYQTEIFEQNNHFAFQRETELKKAFEKAVIRAYKIQVEKEVKNMFLLAVLWLTVLTCVLCDALKSVILCVLIISIGYFLPINTWLPDVFTEWLTNIRPLTKTEKQEAVEMLYRNFYR